MSSKSGKALLLAVIPGLGHLYLGRHWRGLLAFAVFAVAGNGIYLASVSDSSSDESLNRWFLWGAMAAIWAYSMLGVLYLTRRFELKPLKERKDYHFKRGLVQYVSGAFEGARAEFRLVLRLDPMDVDARFHLAMTLKQLGKPAKAVRAFKRCLADDVEAKWAWEVKDQLEKMRKQ